MDARKPVAVGLVALSVAILASVIANEPLSAQGLRGRFRGSQSGCGQQSSSGQQQYSGQQAYPQGGAGTGQTSGGQNSGQPDVSMVTLKTQQGANGQQMVITPKGMVVPLPGAGVNSDVVHVYIGSNGGYWYVDKNNQQVDLTSAVQSMQNGATQTQVPQYAPQPQQSSSSSSSSSSSGAGTAAAAGLGAMTGAMIGTAATSNNSWNNVPYGAPVHYAAGAAPYYNQGGKAVYVNNSNTAEINQANAYHASTVQQQQQWYNKQQTEQTSNWKNWQQPQQASNPFVGSEYQGAQAAAHHGQTDGQAGRYGQADGQANARYGQADGQANARYGQADGQANARNGQADGQANARNGQADGQANGRYGQSEGQANARADQSEGGGRSGGRSGQSDEGGRSGGRSGQSEGGGRGRR